MCPEIRPMGPKNCNVHSKRCIRRSSTPYGPYVFASHGVFTPPNCRFSWWINGFLGCFSPWLWKREVDDPNSNLIILHVCCCHTYQHLPTMTAPSFVWVFHEVGTSRIRPYFEGISPWKKGLKKRLEKCGRYLQNIGSWNGLKVLLLAESTEVCLHGVKPFSNIMSGGWKLSVSWLSKNLEI